LGVKTKVLELAIKHDMVPMKMKWEQAVSAVGSMYKNMYYLLDPEDRIKLSKMMENWGIEHSEVILKRLGASRDLHGCALALISYHRIFGIKSSVVKETEDEIMIHVYRCMWKDKRGWTPKICASIEAFETGLVNGIDSSIKHFYTKRRSLGDPVCEMHLCIPNKIT
jgi:hypothetical protein